MTPVQTSPKRQISPLGEAIVGCLHEIGYENLNVEKTTGGERIANIPGWLIEMVPYGGLQYAASAYQAVREDSSFDNKLVAIVWFDEKASLNDPGVNVFLAFEDIHDCVQDLFENGLRPSSSEKEWIRELLRNEGRCYRIHGNYLGCRAYTPLEDWLLLMTRWKLYDGAFLPENDASEEKSAERLEYLERSHVETVKGRRMRVIDYGSYRERTVILDVEYQIKTFGRPTMGSSLSCESDFAYVDYAPKGAETITTQTKRDDEDDDDGKGEGRGID